ncbi:coiled-coil domain-containing protein 148-like [Diadema antillarum]|uniref:coiled-coil domain-containing protein 148-like n=1 Tax=Diadema antillarum TaxID=105358 RepID=UPI003A84FD1F
MTGRDYRSFLTVHRSGSKETGRADEADKLLIRMKAGLGSTRYQKVDYDQMKAQTLERRIAGNRSLLKMNKLREFSKVSKETTLLKQHRTVWQRELGRLDSQRHRLEREQENAILEGSSEGSSITMFMLEAEDYKMQLEEELEKFRKATAEPIWTLRDDLKVWLARNKSRLDRGEEALEEDHAEVCKVVESVKEQQEEVMKRLSHEQWSLESELESGFLQHVLQGTEKHVVEGIPVEAEMLECPDLELRESVLQEFLLLDEKYLEKLRELDRRHAGTIGLSFGGWTRDDHLIFTSIVEMYPRDMQNRRMLYIDRLKKQFPKKSRVELVAHEDWMINHRYYNQLRHTLINSWARDKQELYERGAATFADACLADELQRAAAIDKHRQEEIRRELYEKVELWREQKLEAMRIEAELEVQRLRSAQRELELEKQKEEKKRAAEKEKINVYKEQLRKEHEAEEAKKRERLAELRKAMAVQAAHDKERVAFRDHLQQLKVEKMKEDQMRLEEEEMERERRLEALREQVAVHVESDPVRMMKDTTASKARMGIGAEQDVNIQRPLFDMRTFPSDKVMADPRLKLEQALRQAGLHENPYARRMLASTQPLRPPRRDMKSTLFKDN